MSARETFPDDSYLPVNGDLPVCPLHSAHALFQLSTGEMQCTSGHDLASVGIHWFSLPSGHIVFVDTDDRDLVERHVWFKQEAGRDLIYVKGYPRGGDIRIRLRLHRVLLDAPDGVEVDHRNHNGLDNRRANLRFATRTQQNGNTRPPANNRSGYKGVSWNKELGKWRATIKRPDRHQTIGHFDDPWQAAQAYNAAAVEVWGEFAYLNQPLPIVRDDVDRIREALQREMDR